MRNLDKEEIKVLKLQLTQLTKTKRNQKTSHGNLRPKEY